MNATESCTPQTMNERIQRALGRLQCPRCRASLSLAEDESSVVCSQCGAVYPIVNGVIRFVDRTFVLWAVAGLGVAFRVGLAAKTMYFCEWRPATGQLVLAWTNNGGQPTELTSVTATGPSARPRT